MKTLFQSQFLFDFDEIFTNRSEKYGVFCDYFKIFFGSTDLNVHDLNTNLNYLSSNILSLYCIFDVQNLVLCLNCELIKIIDYKFMLKLQCKTTFNSVFVGKQIIKIEQESTLE